MSWKALNRRRSAPAIADARLPHAIRQPAQPRRMQPEHFADFAALVRSAFPARKPLKLRGRLRVWNFQRTSGHFWLKSIQKIDQRLEVITHVFLNAPARHFCEKSFVFKLRERISAKIASPRVEHAEAVIVGAFTTDERLGVASGRGGKRQVVEKGSGG